MNSFKKSKLTFYYIFLHVNTFEQNLKCFLFLNDHLPSVSIWERSLQQVFNFFLFTDNVVDNKKLLVFVKKNTKYWHALLEICIF